MSIFGNGGKGDAKRPTQVDEQTFSDNWDRIFAAKKDYYASVRKQNYADSLMLEGLVGSGVTGSISGSNPEGSRSSLDSPATYGWIAIGEEMSTPVTGRALGDKIFPAGPPIYINADTGE